MPIQQFTLSANGVSVFFEVVNIQSAVNQQWGRDNSRVTVTYKIAWADRFKARELLLGKTTRKTVPIPGPLNIAYLSRDPLPHQWIEDEAKNLYCTSITNTEGLAILPQPLCYEQAFITANYEQLPFDVRSDAAIVGHSTYPDESTLTRWVEFGDRHSTGRLIKAYGLGVVFCNEAGAALPNAALAAGAPDPNRPVMNGQLYPFYEDTIPYVWHQVPLRYAPLAIAAGMQNKMNSVAFDGFPVRTLLYMGYRLVRTRLPQIWDGTFPDNTRAVNIQYEFKYQRNRWDAMPDPLREMRWYQVRGMRNTANTMLEEDDFAQLFRPL